MDDEEELECRKAFFKDGKYRTFDDLFLIRSRLIHSQFLTTNQLHCLHQWEFDDLAHKISLVTKNDGEVIFQQGDAAEGFYIIFTGEVLKTTPEGTVVSYTAGDSFGLGREPFAGSIDSNNTLLGGDPVIKKEPEKEKDLKPEKPTLCAQDGTEHIGDEKVEEGASANNQGAAQKLGEGRLALQVPTYNKLKSDLWHVETPHTVDNDKSVKSKDVHTSSELDLETPSVAPGEAFPMENDGFDLVSLKGGPLQTFPESEQPKESEDGPKSLEDTIKDDGSHGSKKGVFSNTENLPRTMTPGMRNASLASIQSQSISSLSFFQPDPRLWNFFPKRAYSAVAKGDTELIWVRYEDYKAAINNTGTTAMLDLINPPPPKKVKPPWSNKKISMERPKSNYELTLQKCRQYLTLPVSQRMEQDLNDLAYLLSLRIEFLKQFNRQQQIRILRHTWLSAIWDKTCIYNCNAKSKAFYIVLTGNVEMRARSTIYDFDGRITEVFDEAIKPFEIFGLKELAQDHKDGKRERSAWTVEKFNELLSIDHKKFNEIMEECKAERLDECMELLLRTEGFNFFNKEMCRDVAQYMEQRRLDINAAICMQRRRATEIIIIQRGECQVQRSLSLEKPRSEQEERAQHYISIGRVGPRTALGLYIISPEIQVSEETYWRETVKTVSSVLVYTIPRVIFYTTLPQKYRMEIKRGLNKITNSVTGLWGQVPPQITPDLVDASTAWGKYRRQLVTGEMNNNVRRPQSPTVGFGSGVEIKGEIPVAPPVHPSKQKLLSVSMQMNLASPSSRPKTAGAAAPLRRKSRSSKKYLQETSQGMLHSTSVQVLSKTTPIERTLAPLSPLRKNRPATTDARIERIALKRQNSKKEWDHLMKQYDITRPMRQSDRYKKGENVYERWCPFQVLELKTNQKQSECFFRVLGGFKTVEDAQTSVLALYGGGSRIEKGDSGFTYAKAVMGEKWQQFQSYELLNLSKSHHVIIFCLDAPIEYVSFQPGDQEHAHIKNFKESARIGHSKAKEDAEDHPLFLPGVSFPSFCKVIAQEWATVSLKETVLDKRNRQKYVLESLLNPPFFRQITLVHQIHGCFATKHYAARAAYGLKTNRANNLNHQNIIICPMYQWLPCNVEDLKVLHIDNDDIRELMEEETQQIGIEIRGHTLNGLTTSVVLRNHKSKHKWKAKIASINQSRVVASEEPRFDWAMVKKLQARDSLQKNHAEKSRRRKAMRDQVLKASLDANETEMKLNQKIFSMDKPMSKNDRKEIQLRQLKDKAQMNVFMALNNLDYKKVLETADDESHNDSLPLTPRVEKRHVRNAQVPLSDKIQVLDTMLKTKRDWHKKSTKNQANNNNTQTVHSLGLVATTFKSDKSRYA